MPIMLESRSHGPNQASRAGPNRTRRTAIDDTIPTIRRGPNGAQPVRDTLHKRKRLQPPLPSLDGHTHSSSRMLGPRIGLSVSESVTSRHEPRLHGLSG
eukprot:266947-Pyramimonas_sp.AAC.1